MNFERNLHQLTKKHASFKHGNHCNTTLKFSDCSLCCQTIPDNTECSAQSCEDTAKAQTSSQRQVTECHSPYPMQVLLTCSSLHHWIPSEAHHNTRMAFLSKTFSREGRKCSRVCCFRIVYVIKYSHSREVSIEGTCLAEGKDHHKLHLYGGTCNNHKLFQAKISTAFCTNKSCWLQKATKEKQRKGEGSADPQERLH